MLGESVKAALDARRKQLEELRRRAEARTVQCPTDPREVQRQLRALDEPIVLFGEGAKERRATLLGVLAERRPTTPMPAVAVSTREGGRLEGGEEEEDFFSQGGASLKALRIRLATRSIERAATRLMEAKAGFAACRALERAAADGAADDNAAVEAKRRMYRAVRDDTGVAMESFECRLMVFGRGHGCARPLTSICAVPLSFGDGGAAAAVATAAEDGTVTLWDADGGGHALGGTVTVGSGMRLAGLSAALLPGGGPYDGPGCCSARLGLLRSTLVAAACRDGNAYVWCVGQQERQPLDGSALAGAEGQESSSSTSPSQQRLQGLGLGAAPLLALRGHVAPVLATAFDPSGATIATTSEDLTWRLWDVETACEAAAVDLHENPVAPAAALVQEVGQGLMRRFGRAVYGIAFHPDGSLVAATNFTGTAMVWDVRTGRLAFSVPGSHWGKCTAVAWSAEGMRMATGGEDGCVHLFDLRRRDLGEAPPQRVAAHRDTIHLLHFVRARDVRTAFAEPGHVHAAGPVLLTGSVDGAVHAWDALSGAYHASLLGHGGPVRGLAMLPPSAAHQTARIVTACKDRYWRVWAAGAGEARDEAAAKVPARMVTVRTAQLPGYTAAAVSDPITTEIALGRLGLDRADGDGDSGGESDEMDALRRPQPLPSAGTVGGRQQRLREDSESGDSDDDDMAAMRCLKRT